MRCATLFPHPPLIVPGVGKGFEIPGTRAACEGMAADIDDFNPETVVIISPHSVLYEDYFHISPGEGAHGSFSRFGAPHASYKVAYDTRLAGMIGGIARENGIPAGPEGERDPALDHGTMVPIHFMKQRRIVRLSLSGYDADTHYRYGRCIRMAAECLGRRVALVASGDMSHKLSPDGPYGICKEGGQFDAYVRECMETADFRRLMKIDRHILEKAAECGYRSIVIMAGFLDGSESEVRSLHYEGPYGVGYLCCSVHGHEDAFAGLARSTVEHFARSGRNQPPRLPDKDSLPPDLTHKRAGVFVSIKKDGDLRGCIGTISPTCENIAQEIVQNGISAARDDPRFSPIQAGELASLSVSVDVLGEPEPIDSAEQLDIYKYGVIISQGRRRGLLLPNLEGIDTVGQQVSIAAAKGGVDLCKPYSLERFEVVRHK